jgi:arginine deiminase
MPKAVPLGVHSEVGTLRAALVCAPGLAHQRLTPVNCAGLLFDEVMDVEQAQRDHDAFVDQMAGRGVDVVELADVLAETMAIPDARAWLLMRLAPTVVPEVRNFLDEITADDLARGIAGGIAFNDLPRDVGAREASRRSDLESGDNPYVLPPLPNLLYTRDSASWIFGGVTLNTFRFPARLGETTVLEAVYRFHPRFAGHARVWTGGDAPGPSLDPLEGGDLLVAGNGVVLAGSGERTSPDAIRALASSLFAAEAATRVVVATLPHERRAMHLDSVLTFADRDCVTAFPPIVDAIRAVSLRPSDADPTLLEETAEKRPFVDVVADALGIGTLRVVPTGGIAESEQWAMGNNVVALSPGVVLAYRHNAGTNAALRNAGIEVVEIPGGQVSRGRGGPHCMTSPLSRDALDVRSSHEEK